MSAFGTFDICLTTAYALYYTATILLYLNKKGKERFSGNYAAKKTIIIKMVL